MMSVNGSGKITVHCEAVVRGDVHLRRTTDQVDEVVKGLILEYLSETCPVFKNGMVQISGTSKIVDVVESLRICDLDENQSVSFWQADTCIYLIMLNDSLPEKDYLDDIDNPSSSSNTTTAYEQWELPNRHLHGLWESIVVEHDVKKRLLGYCSTSILFSEYQVDPNIISWNRMVLLYGPPGTGKTTLCKALANKLFIRCTNDKYESGILMEINSHSLFSRWFSESGKLVMKLFDQIDEIAEDEKCLVVVLIDEVESIASARNASARSNEPGDAVRVVNAVLTSLDTLKRKPNVLVLCTSNMVNGIDEAFRDRVDYSVYIGPPSSAARYVILKSCIIELIQKGIININLHDNQKQEYNFGDMDTIDELIFKSNLTKVANLSESYSGRGLRKLPLRAHAFFLQRSKVSLCEFVDAMLQTVELDQCKSRDEKTADLLIEGSM